MLKIIACANLSQAEAIARLDSVQNMRKKLSLEISNVLCATELVLSEVFVQLNLKLKKSEQEDIQNFMAWDPLKILTNSITQMYESIVFHDVRPESISQIEKMLNKMTEIACKRVNTYVDYQ